jgi:hypothetical protein
MKAILIVPFLLFNITHARCVKDVVAQWKNLESHGNRIEIENKKRIWRRKNSYTMAPTNKLGIDNHFQGVQRIPGENNFVVSGGDIRAKAADLFVIVNGKFHRRINLDMWPYWHPGGIQVHESILAIGVEEWKKERIAKIYFYDFKDPEAAKPLKTWINIPHTKSGAIMFDKLSSGLYILGSHDQSNIEIYFSKTPNINDGFPGEADLILELSGFEKAGELRSAQSVNLIQQCDGKLFMASFANWGKVTPIFNDRDLGQLYSLDISQNPPVAKHIVEKHFVCKRYCNFAGATGINIDKKGRLSVVSSHHFRRAITKKFHVVEFKQKTVKNLKH